VTVLFLKPLGFKSEIKYFPRRICGSDKQSQSRGEWVIQGGRRRRRPETFRLAGNQYPLQKTEINKIISLI